ncbi:probable galactinol--sucrose galactosyltransferase 2 [Pyrus x bretschneideri]|uniref:probable galactinol--sucrose galactosyltransferase 2 n=1 Tax=Pyrus x bretschneideri TaxID=225117 RepID=UPI00202EFBBA|nr:probable galactinol--sucrose galactosyltransferase 2 [Pyrus x bretschneideri]
MEQQIGQIVLQVSERTPGTFPSQTVPNPRGREECNAVRTLRPGKSYENRHENCVGNSRAAPHPQTDSGNFAKSDISADSGQPVTSSGVEGNQPDIIMDSSTVHGLGLNIIQTLGFGHGGRVSLTRSYHQALEASVARNFADNECISCVCHNTDGLYSAKQTAVVRASNDFYSRDPTSHTIHISSVAYNTLFLGEFMQPDWDMFHSLHPAAEYHGAARALGGCAIYVSEKPGNHNFDLLRKLVLPDGSVLRAKLPGRPTRDCLFADPARDRTSLLKIWNVKNLSGVVGVFNCQGADWCKIEKKTRIHDYSPGTLSGSVRAADVEAIAQVAGADWNGETVVYAHKSGDVLRLPKGASVPMTLKVLDYEVFHFCPLKEITSDLSFAPIGLLDMFNSSAAVEQVEIQLASDKKPELSNGEVSENRSPTATISLKTRGCGRFGAYCSQWPLKCTVDNARTNFEYDSASGLTTITIPVPEKEMYRWSVEIQV